MLIHKVLNNNVVIILDDLEREQIVCGKGIAFQKNQGDIIEEDKVNKVFKLFNHDLNDKFQQLLSEIPLEHIQLADDVVNVAKTRLGKNLNESIYISLSDHIFTAITRFLEGITIKNALLWEIKRFYEDEFEIGLIAIEMIEKKFAIHLPDDEAAFIALHIVNSEMDESSMEQVFEVTKIMQEISNLVKYYFAIEFDVSSVYYFRFITHLKFFAQRLIRGNQITENKDDDLLDMIKVKYATSYKCVGKIGSFLKRKYEYKLSNEEELYLTIHIERVIYKTKS